MAVETPHLRQAVINLMKVVHAADASTSGCEPIKITIRFRPTAMSNDDGLDVRVRAKLCCNCPEGSRCRGCKMSNGTWGHMRQVTTMCYLATAVASSASPQKAEPAQGQKQGKKKKKKRAGAKTPRSSAGGEVKARR